MLEINVGVKIAKDVVEGDNVCAREDVMYFKTNLMELHQPQEIESILLGCGGTIGNKKNDFLENSSNWSIVNVESFQVKIGEIPLFENARFLPMPFNGLDMSIFAKNFVTLIGG